MGPFAILGGIAVLGGLLGKKTTRVGGMGGDGAFTAPEVPVVLSPETQAILHPNAGKERSDAPSGLELAQLMMERSVHLVQLTIWEQKASDDYDKYAQLYKEQDSAAIPTARPGQVVTSRPVRVVTEQGLKKKLDVYQAYAHQVNELEASIDRLRTALLEIYGVVAYDLVLRQLDRAIVVEENQFTPTMKSEPTHPEWGQEPFLEILEATKSMLEEDAPLWTEDES